MIFLKKIYLKHFMCIDEAELDLSHKIIIFDGNNGQGKSAVLDAIAICFSEYKKSDSIKEFIQIGHLHSKIILDVEFAGNPIHFDVTLNIKNATPLERDVTYNGKHYINSEVTTLIKSLDLDFYSEIILSMQDTDSIATMTPSQRLNMLQKIFQFDFKKKVEKINDMKSEAQSSLKVLKEQSDFLSSETKVKENRLSTLTKKEVPFDESAYADKQNEIESNSLKIEDLMSHLREKSVLMSERSSIEKANSESTLLLEKCQNEVALYDRAKKSLDDLNYESTKENAMKVIDECKVSLEQTAWERFEASTAINNLKDSLSKGKEKLILLKRHAEDLKKHLDLANAGKCPVCGQSTDSLHTSELEEDIKKTKDDVLECETQNEDVSKRLSESEKTFDELNEKVNKLKFEAQKAVNVVQSLEKMKESFEKDLDVSRLAEVKKQIEALNMTISEQRENIQKANEKIDAYSSDSDSFTQLDKSTKSLRNELKEYDNVITFNAAVESQVKAITEDISQNEEKMSEISKKTIDFNSSIDVYNEVKKVLDTELPNFLVVKTCTKLEDEMNAFVQAVFPSFSIHLLKSKKGVEFFYSKDGSDEMINAKMSSGYEKAVLGIAFRAALSNAYNLSFAAFDEIDAAASDENSIKTFDSLINSDIYNQMFFITHKENTSNYIQSLSNDCIKYHVKKGHFTQRD